MFVELDASHGRDGLGDGLHDVEDLGGDPRRSDLSGSVRDHRDLVRLRQRSSNLGCDLRHDLETNLVFHS